MKLRGAFLKDLGPHDKIGASLSVYADKLYSQDDGPEDLHGRAFLDARNAFLDVEMFQLNDWVPRVAGLDPLMPRMVDAPDERLLRNGVHSGTTVEQSPNPHVQHEDVGLVLIPARVRVAFHPPRLRQVLEELEASFADLRSFLLPALLASLGSLRGGSNLG